MRGQVVVSSGNAASQNIKSALLGMAPLESAGENYWSCEKFGMAEYNGRIVDIEPSREDDFYVFASTHKSEKAKPSFTAHTPGNWGGAMLGGKPRTLNIAFGSKVAAAVRKMKELSGQSLGWEVSVEVDHHGPTLSKPVLFVEIGSGENEWSNKQAGRIAAEGILAAIGAGKAESVDVGFGGSHYCPKFGPMIISGKCVLGHIISGYSLERDGVGEEMVEQAFEKSAEPAKAAMIDWKGIKGGTRGQLIPILESMGIKWVKA